MLLLIGLVAFGLGFCMMFGIAVTATVLTIIIVTFPLYSRIPRHRRSLSVRIAALAVTVLAVYFGSFGAFRVFRTYEFSLAPSDDPQHNLVIFSLEPSVQQFARDFYSPLIRLFPAHCYYPDDHEIRLLNRGNTAVEP